MSTWGPWVNWESHIYPDVGDYVQLRTLHKFNRKKGVVEGIVSDNEKGSIGLIPKPVHDGMWFWTDWRKRLISEEGLHEVERCTKVPVRELEDS